MGAGETRATREILALPTLPVLLLNGCQIWMGVWPARFWTVPLVIGVRHGCHLQGCVLLARWRQRLSTPLTQFGGGYPRRMTWLGGTSSP